MPSKRQSKIDPYKHKDSTIKRRDRILKNMYEDGYISQSQYEKSVDENITIMPKKETTTNDYAETYILKCATEALMKEQGFEFKTTFSSTSEKESYNDEYDELYNTCKKSLYSAGYRIYTSIDMEKQKQLQDSVSSQLSMFTEKTDDGVYKVQGAAVSIDNSTGKVAAIVGGREEDRSVSISLLIKILSPCLSSSSCKMNVFLLLQKNILTFTLNYFPILNLPVLRRI